MNGVLRRSLPVERVRAIFTRAAPKTPETLVAAENGLYRLSVGTEDDPIVTLDVRKRLTRPASLASYEWDTDAETKAILYAVASPDDSGACYFSTHTTLMRLNTDDSVELVAGSWDEPGERNGTGAEALVHAPLCLAATGPIALPAPATSQHGASGIRVSGSSIGGSGPGGAGHQGLAVEEGGFLFFAEGGHRLRVRRARLASPKARPALAAEVVTLTDIITYTAISALAYDCGRDVLYVATQRAIHRITDPCGANPSMEEVVSGAWERGAPDDDASGSDDDSGSQGGADSAGGEEDEEDSDREAAEAEDGLGALGLGEGDGDGADPDGGGIPLQRRRRGRDRQRRRRRRRDGGGGGARGGAASAAVAPFRCICDIAVDSRGHIYVTEMDGPVLRIDPSDRFAVQAVPAALGGAASASLALLPGGWLCVYEWGGSRLQLSRQGLKPSWRAPPPPPPPPPDLTGLADDWSALLADPYDTSDITITVGDRAFHAHRLVLSTRCEYFRRQFAAACRDSRAREVSLQDAHPAAFEQVLRHLYTGCLDFPEPLLRPVLALADRLLLPRVVARVQQQLLATAAPATVVGDLLWAERMGFRELLAGLKGYYLTHETRVLSVAGEAVRGMMVSHPDLFFELHCEAVRKSHPPAW